MLMRMLMRMLMLMTGRWRARKRSGLLQVVVVVGACYLLKNPWRDMSTDPETAPENLSPVVHARTSVEAHAILHSFLPPPNRVPSRSSMYVWAGGTVWWVNPAKSYVVYLNRQDRPDGRQKTEDRKPVSPSPPVVV
jgi:hypothetical protein